MNVLLHILLIPVYILAFFFSSESEESEDPDEQYESLRENQIDVESGEVISVEKKRVGL
jgi:hypothetical protein